MSGIIEMGIMKVELDVSTQGPLSKNEVDMIQRDLLKFFEKKKLNISGKIKFLRVTTFEVEHNNAYTDTSSK